MEVANVKPKIEASVIPVDCKCEEFISCFCETFVNAYHKMTVEVVCLANKESEDEVGATNKPADGISSADDEHENTQETWKVRVAEVDLRPHVCHVLKQDFDLNCNLEITRDRLRTTRVDHVQWVGAVLLRDEVASRALLYIVNTKVAKAIHGRFRDQPCAGEAILDLPSHVLMAGNDLENSRLSGYRGLAALDSWLIGIGVNFVYNKCNRKRAISLDDSDDQASGDHQFSPAATRVDSRGIEKTAAGLRRRLIAAIAVTIPRMTSQERLVFLLVWIKGAKPSEAADYLGVSRPRISQILTSIREKVADNAEDVLTQLECETGRSKVELARYLSELLVYVSDIQKEPSLQILNHSASSTVSEIVELVTASGQVTNSSVKAR